MICPKCKKNEMEEIELSEFFLSHNYCKKCKFRIGLKAGQVGKVDKVKYKSKKKTKKIVNDLFKG